MIKQEQKVVVGTATLECRCSHPVVGSCAQIVPIAFIYNAILEFKDEWFVVKYIFVCTFASIFYCCCFVDVYFFPLQNLLTCFSCPSVKSRSYPNSCDWKLLIITIVLWYQNRFAIGTHPCLFCNMELFEYTLIMTKDNQWVLMLFKTYT